MTIKKALIPIILAHILATLACAYIVLPEDVGGSGSLGSGEWIAWVTHVGESDAGDLHIDITIRNETGDWSAMTANVDEPAVLTQSDGTKTNCDTVYVSSGGHRLAPGFQMRGFITGKPAEPITQSIYVECPPTDLSPGTTLNIEYSFVTGQYNYYEPEANKANGTFELDLDQVQTDLTYPIGNEVSGLIQAPDVEITAINNVILTLVDVQRLESGLKFSWQTDNPGEYPSYVHIGNPPVIGDDGILYGIYETPDIVSVPITPAEGSTEWETEVAVPQNVASVYIMLSVESGKQRLFANYAIDVSEE